MATFSNPAETSMSASQINIEAMTRSSQIWVAGLQEISKTMAEMAKAQLENSLAVCKALSGVTSVSEAVDLQTKHAHACCSTAMSNTSAISDATMKLAHQTMAPMMSPAATA